jgi:hypothetical protein
VLPRLIKQIAKETKAQLFLTSHSPLLVNFFDASEICFISRTENGRTRAAPLDSLRTFSNGKEYFGVGDLWANMNIQNINDEVAKIAKERDEEALFKIGDRERAAAFMGTP